MSESTDNAIVKFSNSIREKIKCVKLYGEKLDLENKDAELVAAYLSGREDMRAEYVQQLKEVEKRLGYE